MLARLLYLILITFIARLVLRAAAEWLGAGSEARGGSGRGGARPVGQREPKRALVKGRMVRDPVCGLNLPEDRATTRVLDGERFYFCSDRCRDLFAPGEKRARA